MAHTKVIISVGGNDHRSQTAVAHQVCKFLASIGLYIQNMEQPMGIVERRREIDRLIMDGADVSINTEPLHKASINDAMAPILQHYAINEVLAALLEHSQEQMQLGVDEDGQVDQGWKCMAENIRATLDLVY